MFVKLENNKPVEWPVSVQRIFFENKNTSFPADISNVNVRAYGFAPFKYSDPQTYDAQWQEAHEIAPIEIDDVFVQQWKIVEKYTSAEKELLIAQQAAQAELDAAAFVRSQRDMLLASTDWVVIKAQETGASVALEWATYRQALRDITAQEGFPHNVTWPTKP